MNTLRDRLRAELETPLSDRPLGSGWLSGLISLVGGVAVLTFALCLEFPTLFTIPELRESYARVDYRLVIQSVLVISYVFAILNLTLRRTKILGGVALAALLMASFILQFGGEQHRFENDIFFGLDWLVLNVTFTGLLFIPLERMIPLRQEQRLFRTEWREDLFYYFVSSMLVQIFTVLSLWPSLFIASHTDWSTMRGAVASQPSWLQLLEIMFLTDLVQYWVHRAFHRIPWLWKFHAVHHSARAMDWMAGARMHFIEIIVLRGFTVIPMQIFGFSTPVIHGYILLVYLYSTFIHSNIKISPCWLCPILVTPRFHHWHHGIEREAIDVNFAIHFPIFDRLFNTYYNPDKWPSGYGISGHPVPLGYWKQFMYPLKRNENGDDPS